MGRNGNQNAFVETLSLCFGIVCVIPATLLGLAIWLAFARREKLPRKLTWIVALVICAPALLATASTLWYMVVEEPRRIEAGEPI